MLDNRSITSRYIGLFLLGTLLFSHPVFSLFSLDIQVLGIPLFFFYIFTAWLALILLVMVFGKTPKPFQSREINLRAANSGAVNTLPEKSGR
jgi:predicted permease